MFEYVTVKEDLFADGIGEFTSFGIKVFLVMDERYEIGTASDVADSFPTVDRIASYCNKKQISPIDLRETVTLFI